MPNVYTIPRFNGEPQFDRIPVWKLTCDRQTPPNDRIFAQAQLCRNDERLFIRIWTFEPSPSPDVLLSCLISRRNHLVAATVSAGGDFALVADGEKRDTRSEAYLFTGEDLQGVYTGAVMSVPLEEILNVLASDDGNFDTATVEINLLRVGASQASVSSLVPVGSSREMSL